MEERIPQPIPSIGEKVLREGFSGTHDILSSLRFPNFASPGTMTTPRNVD